MKRLRYARQRDGTKVTPSIVGRHELLTVKLLPKEDAIHFEIHGETKLLCEGFGFNERAVKATVRSILINELGVLFLDEVRKRRKA